ncbi:MAG: T9SS C-terminal target domain-containing protein [Ignavibacteriae bacterium]|nr:MAG: T9SS C-terminal target domain-containing protein [Ignavibacteriota bacterium]
MSINLKKWCAATALLIPMGILSPKMLSQEFVLRMDSAPSQPSNITIDSKTAVQGLTEKQMVTFETAQLTDLLHYQPQQLTLSLPSGLPISGRIVLQRRSIFTPDAQVVRRTDNGDQPVPFKERWLNYSGKIEGVEGSLVALNVSPFGVDAMIAVNKERYHLLPTSDRTATAQSDQFITARSLPQSVFTCGNMWDDDPGAVEAFIEEYKKSHPGAKNVPLPWSQTHHIVPQIPISPAILNGPISTDTIEVRVALEGDYDLKLTTGSVDSAITLMVATVSYASAIYESEVHVRLTVPFVRVWDTPSDPYSQDMFVALDQFASTWKATMDTVPRTTAHLFVSSAQWTTSPTVAGIARLNSLCSSVNGYAVTNVKNPATLEHLMTFAHELGHNFGAYHTHSCLWPNGPIDYCSTVEGNCYNGPVVDQTGTIMSYCSTRIFQFGSIVASLIRRNAEVAWCAPSITQVPVASADSIYLQALYSAANGATWKEKTNWDKQIAGRYGIAVRNGRVVSIDLAANNLRGTLPAGLTGLTELRKLNLSGRNHFHLAELSPPTASDIDNANSLTGQIPADINALSNLEYLDLSNNQLTGTIPNGMGSLSQLRWLDLSQNQITGALPSTLGNLLNLEMLDVWRNSLSGTLPSELGNLRLLHWLLINENYTITGTLPAAISNLTKLNMLLLNINNLSGTIPTQIDSLTQLTYLDLSRNKFTGTIPVELGTLAGLKTLSLSDNLLTGSIPSSLGSLQKATWLNLSNNQLSGSIPSELGPMNLWHLDLSGNQLTGTIPASFGNLTQVVELNLGSNQLSGALPDSMRHVGSNFYPGLGGFFEFSVNDNHLTGSIPDWLGTESQFGTMTTLKLGGNKFTVTTVPSWIPGKNNLTRLWLNDLGFTGTIPAQLGSLTGLFELKLSGNQFTGAIPAELGKLTRLQLLWLSNNQLSGPIPAALGNLSSIMYLRLSQNKLSGTVPAGFNNMTNLVELGLNDNNLENVPNLADKILLAQDPSSFTAIQNNKLTFDDIAPLISLGLKNFTYSPQQSFDTLRVLTVSTGSDVRLTVKPDGAKNSYQWKKNGVNITGATSRDYQLVSLTAVDTGGYTVEVGSSTVPLLKLLRAPINLRVDTLQYPLDMTLVSPQDGAQGVPFPVTLDWNHEGLATRYEVQVDTSGTFAVILFRDSAVTGLSRALNSLPQATRYYWRVRAANSHGVGFWSDTRIFLTTGIAGTGVREETAVIPAKFALLQNYPNPFNPTTTIRFSLAQREQVSLKIFDILGREISTLADGILDAGQYQTTFDASRFASGIYFYRINAGEFTATKRLVLIR